MLPLIKFQLNKQYTDKFNSTFTVLTITDKWIELINKFGVKHKYGKTILNNIETIYDCDMHPFLYAGKQEKENINIPLIITRKSRKEMEKIHTTPLNFKISFIDIYNPINKLYI